jgi:hypothetical protein
MTIHFLSLASSYQISGRCEAGYPQVTNPTHLVCALDRTGNFIALTRLKISDRVSYKWLHEDGKFYRPFFETRATNSSNLESKSFRMGDLFDFL